MVPFVLTFLLALMLCARIGVMSDVQALDREYYGDEQNPGGHVEHGYASSKGLDPSIDAARVIGLAVAVLVTLIAVLLFYRRQRTQG